MSPRVAAKKQEVSGANTQLGCHGGEPNVGGPDSVTLQYCGGEEVHIDPAETSAEETSRTHKGDDFRVGNCVRLVHLPVGGEKPAATAKVADLAEHQGMPNHFAV